MHVDQNAPLFFWPHRLDPVQKGCTLLADTLYEIVHRHWESNLQIAIVANGQYQQVFKDIIAFHNFYDRVTVCDFDEHLSRLGFAAADFMLMPSRFEPCGLPQMTCQYYGAIPVVHDTGGLHDTVNMLNEDGTAGNGIVFCNYDSYALRWAVDEAMRFYRRPAEWKQGVISRIMNEARKRFNHDVTAQEYIKIYESMLSRPLVVD